MSSWDKLNTRVKAAFIKRAVANGVSDLDRIIELFNEAEQAKQSDELLYQDFKRSLPKPLQDESQYRLRDYWEYNNRPSDFQQGVQKRMFNLEEDGAYHANSVQYNPNTGSTEFMKHKDHPTVDLELLQFYNNPELKEFRERHNLDMSGDYYKYVPKNKFGEGGATLC